MDVPKSQNPKGCQATGIPTATKIQNNVCFWIIMIFSRYIFFFVVGTVPILFAAVQPWVWSFYTACIFAAFLILFWQNQKKNMLWTPGKLFLFTVGIFFVVTLVQCLPIPSSILSFLCPFRYDLLTQSNAIIGTSISWHTLSYSPLSSFAWWIFLLSLYMFFLVCKECCASQRQLKLLPVVP